MPCEAFARTHIHALLADTSDRAPCPRQGKYALSLADAVEMILKSDDYIDSASDISSGEE